MYPCYNHTNCLLYPLSHAKKKMFRLSHALACTLVTRLKKVLNSLTRSMSRELLVYYLQ